MNNTVFESLFAYHYSAYDQIWESAVELSLEQYTRESGYSLGSVRNHLVHAINVDDRWLARIQHQTPPQLMDEADYPDQASLRETWKVIAGRVSDYISALGDDELDEFVDLDFPLSGGRKRNLRWQLLLHMVNHGTDHRAQILSLLHVHGAPTFEQDYILHVWEAEEQ